MLSEKENLLRMYHGEMPEYLPRGGMANVRCSYFPNVKTPGYHVDEFGVEYIGKDGIFDGTPIPYPGRYILHDITRWRDDVKIPSLEGIDWERLAKEDTKYIDRSKQAFSMWYGKIFQKLTDFMGFTEGLCAIAEEPEEVYALFDAICTFMEELIKNLLYYYKPDAICIPDDTATARAPFISPAMYRQLVKPFHQRIADLVLNNGTLLEMHDCGKCDDFVEDWVEMGVTSWNPAQPQNDLVAVKKKYGRKLIICGGWDSQGAVSDPEYDDDLFMAELKKYVDTLAPGGGFIFSAMSSGNFSDPALQHKMKLIGDFYGSYARDWYKTH